MSNGTNTNTSGKSDVQFSATDAVEGVDQLSDPVMTEVARRLHGTIGTGISGAVHTGDSPPQDKSLLWDKGDGQLYRYDTATGQWVPSTAFPEVDEFPGVSGDDGNIIEEREDGIFAEVPQRIVSTQGSVGDAAGGGTSTVELTIDPPFGNSEYAVIITPRCDMQAGVFWRETTKNESSVIVKFTLPAAYNPETHGSAVQITAIENPAAD